MNPLSYLLLALCTLSYAFGAPTNSSDAATLHQNALDAQILNTEFQQMKETDPCDSGQMACIAATPATCKFGSWQLASCHTSGQCFALPLQTTRGTAIACVSESEAESLFQAAGVPGGPISNSTTSKVVLPTFSDSFSSTPTSKPCFSRSSSVDAISIATSTPTTDAGIAVVTVTVTVPPASFSSALPTSVTTIKPDQAMRILQSLIAHGASIVPPSPASAATPSPANDEGVSTLSSNASHTKHCTMAPSSSTSAVSQVTQPPAGAYHYRRSLNARRAHVARRS